MGKVQPVGVEERFWSKVAKTEDPWACWPWQAGKDSDGYGRFGLYKGRTWMAHRVAFELSRGRDIKDGLHVLHDCDNPACVNPCHLTEGTTQENTADRDRKGRAARGERSGSRLHPDRLARGEKNGCSKLTPNAVRTIRRKRWEGAGVIPLAEEFDVTPSLISQICLWKRWTHISDSEEVDGA